MTDSDKVDYETLTDALHEFPRNASISLHHVEHLETALEIIHNVFGKSGTVTRQPTCWVAQYAQPNGITLSIFVKALDLS